MTIEEAKNQVEKYREGLTGKTGAVVQFSATGPASMGLIHALLAVCERQQKEIDDLRMG